MNLTLVIGSMRGGGAQRVLANLANYFDSNGYNVSIVTVAPEFDYTVNSSIKCYSVYEKSDLKKSIFNKIKRRLQYPLKFFNTLKNTKPDLIISFLVGLNKEALLISKILKKPIIVTEHTNYKADMTIINKIERKYLYKYADALTVLTEFDYKNYYSKFLKNVHIMPNPLSFEPIKEQISRNKTILACGGLNRWEIKGFDSLIKAYSNIAFKYPEWKLEIAGFGEEGHKYLENLANELNIKDYIDFIGFQKDIDKVMKKSSIFVMSSRYEGFSMGLIEAMSQGCACISYDCIAGPNEIIVNKDQGILIENQNIDELSESIEELINNNEAINILSINAIERSKEFHIEIIGNKWISLINSLKKGLE